MPEFEITLRHECSPVNLLYIFRTPFLKNTSRWLLLLILKKLGWGTVPPCPLLPEAPTPLNGQKIITIYILTNISRSINNQGITLGQLME